jgi:NAD(P)-dependent dehydrogenase (short-subunit alcohol dehydrogenase family)
MHAKELFSLEGKVAIVTGGRGLYGAAICEGLCEMGATVIVASRNGEKCEEFAETLRQQGHNAFGMALDLSDDASIKALPKAVVDRFGIIIPNLHWCYGAFLYPPLVGVVFDIHWCIG